ncbi:hypothetical protein F5876DRAFT_653, partial [Lentinula aff. lateritia]
VCKAIEAQCFEEMKKMITLSDSTLHRRVHNGRSHAEAKEEQQWLNNAEEEVLINEVIYYAERGFPLKEHADQIAQARHGENFPVEGVRKNWMSHFISNHNNRI